MIKVLEPSISLEDAQAVADFLKMGWVSHHGPQYARFAHDLEDYLGLHKLNKRIVLTSSGSTALHIAYVLSGLRNAQLAAIPALTYTATLNALFQETKNILIVDVNQFDWNMKWQYIDRSDSKVSHIITVDLFGMPFDYSEDFEKFVRKNNIVVIEDAAESLGSKDAQGRFTGTRGDYGAFSFFANKIITSGEGGALVVPDWQYEEAYNLVSHYPGGLDYFHSKPGYNYRMTHMSATLGRYQLYKLGVFKSIKEWVRDYYTHYVNSPAYFQGHMGKPNFWLNAVSFPSKKKRDDVIAALKANDIDYRYVFTPLSELPFAKHLPYVGQGNARSIVQRSVCLPSSVTLDDIQLELICKVVNDAQR